MDSEKPELVAEGENTVLVRGKPVKKPRLAEYASYEINLEDAPNVYVIEFCRLLAASARNSVLATADERRTCVPPGLEQVMQLEEWNHPDLVNGELPSSNESFKSLAEVLAYGNVSAYRPSEEPNTHWKNWPEGVTL